LLVFGRVLSRSRVFFFFFFNDKVKWFIH